jgi:hypothetical protein
MAKRRIGSKAGQRADPIPFAEFEYLDYAVQFYQTFHKAPTFHPISWPRYFLLCHSLELALKAYLAKLGATTEHLRKLERRHNLNKLLDEVVEKGYKPRPRSAKGSR